MAIIASALLPVRPAAAVPVTPTGSIDWHDVRQPIDGFGASDAFNQGGELMAYPEKLRTQILDSLFSPTTGAGLSIVRHEVPNMGGPLSFSCKDLNQLATDPECYRTDRDPGAVWFNREAKTRGATYTLGSVWSPPRWMKTNNDYNNGGHVRPEMYPQYADYLLEYVKRYKTDHGMTIDGVSIANEPNAATNYPSSEWTGEEMRVFLRDHLKPKMAEEGLNFDVIVPEVSGWSDYLVAPTLADPAAAEVVDVVAAHGYHFVESPSPLLRARDANKRVWQTEMSEFCGCIENTIDNGIKWARWIHEFMTRAETSAWLYWWAVSVVDDGTSQQTLVNLKKSDMTAVINKRLWTLGNFSRFVRPGWVRVETRTDAYSPNTLLSAYRDPSTGKFAVVAINDGTKSRDISLALNGFTSASVTPYRTSATLSLGQLAPVAISDGALTTRLPARSVTTFVGDGAPTTDWRLSSAKRVVVSPGQSVQVPTTLTNAGAASASTTVISSGPPALELFPRSQTVNRLRAGGSRDTSLTVYAPDGTPPGAYPIDVTASGGTQAIRDRTKVTVVGDKIEFSPGTAEEAEWLAEPGSSKLGGPAYDGQGRFADGTGAYGEFPRYFVYGFDLPADVTEGTISVDMLNQFKVSASTDGRNFTEVLREDRPIKDGSNRAWYDFDVATLAQGGNRVFLRFEDASINDGWGVQVLRVRATLSHTGLEPVIPESPLAPLLPGLAVGVGAAVIWVRRRRSQAA